MSRTDYFCRQAELCAQLANVASVDDVALRFQLLALDMLLKAADALDDLQASTAGGGAPDIFRRTK